jgi:hypothetical protein
MAASPLAARLLAVTVARRKATQQRMDAVEVDIADGVQACRSIGLSWAEIAEIVEMSEDAVSKRYGSHRGRRSRAKEDDTQALLPFSGECQPPEAGHHPASE